MTASLPSISAALQWAKQALQGGESPSVDAKVMLQHALNCNATYLLTWPERCLNDSQWQCYQQWVALRLQGQPVAYIVGEQAFWSLVLNVSPATLIPRPDTEILVEQALKLLPYAADTDIVDLGTGTGAVALALASELPKARVSASDIRPEAVALATLNAQRLGLNSVSVVEGSWFEPYVGQRFDMVVSNPPYIDPQDPHLKQGDVRFEPLTALIADDKGLADIATIIQQAPHYLKPSAWLLFEHGYDQAPAVAALLAQSGFTEIFNQVDYAGLPRVSGGRWKSMQ